MIQLFWLSPKKWLFRRDFMVSLLCKLGFLLNLKKFNLTPTHQFIFLGLVQDTSVKAVELTEEEILCLHCNTQHLLSWACISCHEAKKFLVRTYFAAFAVPWAHLLVHALHVFSHQAVSFPLMLSDTAIWHRILILSFIGGFSSPFLRNHWCTCLLKSWPALSLLPTLCGGYAWGPLYLSGKWARNAFECPITAGNLSGLMLIGFRSSRADGARLQLLISWRRGVTQSCRFMGITRHPCQN